MATARRCLLAQCVCEPVAASTHRAKYHPLPSGAYTLNTRSTNQTAFRNRRNTTLHLEGYGLTTERKQARASMKTCG